MNGLRYAVLHHTGMGQPHFDVMFESAPGSPLTTFRMDQWPPPAAQIATPLGDHRPIYLTYEGPISGDRGQVRRVAEGRCTVERDGPAWRVVFFSEKNTPIGLRFAPDARETWSATPFQP